MRIVGVFPPRPPVDLWPQRGLVRVLEPLYITTDVGLQLDVPAGFYSDGASVPAILWTVLEAGPLQLLVMGIGHDCAYRYDAVWTLPPDADPTDCSMKTIERPEADDLALALALWSEASELDGWKIRWGLGVGAAPAFQKKMLNWAPGDVSVTPDQSRVTEPSA